MDSMIKILLVEDDLSLSKSVYDFLKSLRKSNRFMMELKDSMRQNWEFMI